MVNPRNELDEEIVAVDTLDKFKRQLSEFDPINMEVMILAQTGVF